MRSVAYELVRWASIVALAAVVVACGSATSSTESPLTRGAAVHKSELLRGRKVFQTNCAVCHGADGGGGVGVRLRGGRLTRDFPDAAAQIAFVETGKGVMPAWKDRLSPAEVRASCATNARCSANFHRTRVATAERSIRVCV
jgi:mono/diheme cytochrome c family protein